MNTKKIPLRQCVGCGEMKNKKELIRVIKTPENTIVWDHTGRKNGRGAYLCASLDCFREARKTKAIERSLKSVVMPEVYDALEKELKKLDGDK